MEHSIFFLNKTFLSLNHMSKSSNAQGNRYLIICGTVRSDQQVNTLVRTTKYEEQTSTLKQLQVPVL